jgi:hypothetical protein
MRQDNRRTSSATRQARIKGTAGGSQPRPRPTQVSTMKQQGPLKPKATTTASQRSKTTGTARVTTANERGKTTGTTRSGPAAQRSRPSTRVTTSNRTQSPRLPNLPKNPVTGTTNTIRATGGGSNYTKINRLSAQASKPTPRKPAGPKVMPSGMAKAVSSAMSLRKITPAGLAYETLKARPTADGTLAYNQKLAASIMKKKKKG